MDDPGFPPSTYTFRLRGRADCVYRGDSEGPGTLQCPNWSGEVQCEAESSVYTSLFCREPVEGSDRTHTIHARRRVACFFSHSSSFRMPELDEEELAEDLAEPQLLVSADTTVPLLPEATSLTINTVEVMPTITISLEE